MMFRSGMNASGFLAVLAVLVLLTLSACRSGTDFLGSSLPKDDSNASVDSRVQAEASNDSSLSESGDANMTPEEAERIESIDEVTEVATYDIKNTCKEDSAGIVRVFDENGKKLVFRPFCDGLNIVSFDCEGASAKSVSKRCSNGCVLDNSRNAVCRASAPPQRNPDPRRTGGDNVEKLLR